MRLREGLDVKQVAKDVQDISWAGLDKRQEFTAVLVNTHLTHQQRIANLLHRLVVAIHEYPGRDGRNEKAKEWAARIIEAVGRDYPFPLI